MKIIVLVDHLRIGGRERLALDQMYAMSDRQIESILVSLDSDATHLNPNFLSQKQEQAFINKIKKIELTNRKSRWIIYLWRLYGKFKPDLIIAHTLPAVAVSRILRLFMCKKFHINAVIHQLPSLSDKNQRYRRMFYSQFADSLFGYSKAVKMDWDKHVASNKIAKLLFKRRIEVLRNGIYINRLPPRQWKIYPGTKKVNSSLRLVFIGRIIAWKGIEKFTEIYDAIKDMRPRLLIITPSANFEIQEKLYKVFDGKVEFLIGGTLADYTPEMGDVHVYPVDYGPAAQYVESISLNCLEMAILGIKSVVTSGGCGTWPELVKNGIFIETDWNSLAHIRSSILSASQDSLNDQDMLEVSKLVNIENNLMGHFGPII